MVPAHHDRKLALLQGDDTARDRCIEHGRSTLGDLPGDRLAGGRRDCAHVNVGGPGPQASDDTVLARGDRLQRSGVRHHGEDHV